MLPKVVVLDNGGDTIKIGYAGHSKPLHIVPNACARIKRQLRLLVADEVESKIKDHSQLHWIRPIDRGYVTDPAVQEIVWNRILGPNHMNVVPSESSLLLSMQPYTLEKLASRVDEIIFEKYGFSSYYRAPPQVLSSQTLKGRVHSTKPDLGLGNTGLTFSSLGTGVVVDSGFSCTQVLPFSSWLPIGEGLRRVDVGGKALTAYLRELISFRQVNLMDDPWLVNQIKNSLAFVALDFPTEMELARRLSHPSVLMQLHRQELQRKRQEAQEAHRVAMEKAKQLTAQTNTDFTSPSAAASESSNAQGLTERRRKEDASDVVVGGRGSKGLSFGSPGTTDSNSPTKRKKVPIFSLKQDQRGLLLNPYSHAQLRPENDGTGFGIRREFVLPDYLNVNQGYVKGSSSDPFAKISRTLEQYGSDFGLQADEPTSVVVANTGTGEGKLSEDVDMGDAQVSTPTATSPDEVEDAGEEGESVSNSKRGKRSKRDLKGGNGAKKGGKVDEASSGESSGSGGSEDEDEDESEIESESEEENEESEDSNDEGEYRLKSSKKSEVPAAPTRTRSSRAAATGVTSLMSSLQREGLVLQGDEDEEGGGRMVMPQETLPPALRARIGGSTGGYAFGTYGSEAYMPAAAATGAGTGISDSNLQGVFLSTERISVPEALFSPNLLGLNQRGLAEAIRDSIHMCPVELQPMLWSSIMLTGGNACMPGFEARLAIELRRLAPSNMPIRLYTPEDPIITTWKGGSVLGSSDHYFTNFAITKHMWHEEGPSRIFARFKFLNGLKKGPGDPLLENHRIRIQQAQAAADAEYWDKYDEMLDSMVDEEDVAYEVYE